MRMMLLIINLVLIAGCQSGKKDGEREAKTMENLQSVKPSRETRVTSTDGTKIAFDKAGQGPPLIIVNGALTHRRLFGDQPLVAKLSKHFTVYTYDRRGRGESTDVQPYTVEREIEDLAALIDDAGGSAYLYGVSSGAALALQAAAKLGPTKVRRLAVYDLPYGAEPVAYAKQKQRIDELVETGEPGQAAEFFLTGIGTPPEAIASMKRSGEWDQIKKFDFTLAYDFAVLGDGAVPQDTARAITVPALVMNGEKSMDFMQASADQVAKLMSHADRKTLAGQTHEVDANAIAPILIGFFAPARS